MKTLGKFTLTLVPMDTRLKGRLPLEVDVVADFENRVQTEHHLLTPKLYPSHY